MEFLEKSRFLWKFFLFLVFYADQKHLTKSGRCQETGAGLASEIVIKYFIKK